MPLQQDNSPVLQGAYSRKNERQNQEFDCIVRVVEKIYPSRLTMFKLPGRSKEAAQTDLEQCPWGPPSGRLLCVSLNRGATLQPQNIWSEKLKVNLLYATYMLQTMPHGL